MVYRAASHIAFPSHALANDFQCSLGLPERKCVVVPRGMADPLPDLGDGDASPSGNAVRLVCVARLAPSKGQDTLIRALALLGASGTKVLTEFVGAGPCLERYQQLAGHLGVSDQCNFSGMLPHHEVLKRMRAATATVLPSLDEAFGVVVVESLAVGTPVIASRVGGIPEIIRNEVDGFLVPAQDPEALADRIHHLIRHPELQQQMRANARERFMAHYLLEKVAAQMAHWLQEVVREAK